jgi:hypothetical protein
MFISGYCYTSFTRNLSGRQPCYVSQRGWIWQPKNWLVMHLYALQCTSLYISLMENKLILNSKSTNEHCRTFPKIFGPVLNLQEIRKLLISDLQVNCGFSSSENCESRNLVALLRLWVSIGRIFGGIKFRSWIYLLATERKTKRIMNSTVTVLLYRMIQKILVQCSCKQVIPLKKFD